MRMLSLLAATAVFAGSAAGAAPLPKPTAFGICSVCHKVDDKGGTGIGPNLWKVGGRTSGTLPGYAYSPAMKAAKIKWTKKELMAFVADPQKRVPGTKMTYAGQKDPREAAAIAEYLMSLK